HHHDDDDDDDDDHCCCHHDHDQEHEHDHDHEHHHHHHHGHDADEVFTSIGIETSKKYSKDDILNALEQLDKAEYGIILRAKGIVAGAEGEWLHFDYTPGEPEVRTGSSDVIGKICVIGSKIDEEKIKALF
ncbi:MAG: GTP-binding protein, partial [Lachnospiraceae bacterium]|nr:GTP-binding protein [Lachnospiraceae bacterium]